MTGTIIGTDRQLLTIGDLRTLFRCGRTTAYARVHEDGFPTPIVLSDSAHRWWEHEVINWLEQQRAEPRANARATKPLHLDTRPRPVDVRRRGA